MNAALRALLTGLIDYAGLFPPAKLPMGEAVRNYLRYRDQPEAWMLGRFICPAARLGELAAFEKEIGERPLLVSALARGGESASDALKNFQTDVDEARRCEGRHKGNVTIDAFEVRLPAELFGSPDRISLWMVEVALAAPQKDLFFEVPVQHGQVAELIEGVRAGPAAPLLGVKFRCGGLEASAIPSGQRLADALAGCLRHLMPFKATAGLHHPFPRFDHSVKARMHGFINLFAAGAFVWCRGVSAAEAAAILDDDAPEAFRFDDGGLRWRDHAVSTDEIRRARELFALSFGSCSFDEPRDDLRALGWL
jgi:hypothetical protein